MTSRNLRRPTSLIIQICRLDSPYKKIIVDEFLNQQTSATWIFLQDLWGTLAKQNTRTLPETNIAPEKMQC